MARIFLLLRLRLRRLRLLLLWLLLLDMRSTERPSRRRSIRLATLTRARRWPPLRPLRPDPPGRRRGVEVATITTAAATLRPVATTGSAHRLCPQPRIGTEAGPWPRRRRPGDRCATAVTRTPCRRHPLRRPRLRRRAERRRTETAQGIWRMARQQEVPPPRRRPHQCPRRRRSRPRAGRPGPCLRRCPT